MAIDDIRNSIPELDAQLDPSKFTASEDVVTAPSFQADVERLAPPTDINAAEIGDYTPYEAVSGELDDNSTVQGRMSGLLSQTSDYIQRARTNADQMSNRRGMLNSSMAMGAAEGAAIDRALPIAQQDAAAFKEQEFLNQGYDNDAARYLAEQSVERENLEAGLEQDTNQFNQTNQLTNERLNADAQNLSGREFTQAQNLAAANAAAEANRLNFAVLDGDIRAQLAEIDNTAAMRLESMAREYAIIENLDSINGAIYEQLVSQIGSILATEKKSGTAQAKVNALIASAGVEFAFSSGTTNATTAGGPQANATFMPKKPGKDYYWNEEEWAWKRRKLEFVGSSDGSCFVGDTLVRMADGSDRQIADIKQGEVVRGMNGEKNIVLDIEVPELGARGLYSFNGGKPFVTEEHPFMTSKGWRSITPAATAKESQLPVKELAAGHFLEGISKEITRLDTLESHTFDPETLVYNLLLSGNHTYYAAGLLVHNKDGGGGGGGAPSGGVGDGCFAKGTRILMGDGRFKEIQNIQVGEKINGGTVTQVKSGLSTRDWYDFKGVHLTDDHFVFENGEWKYAKNAIASKRIPPHDMFYTLNCTNHKLFGINDTAFTDDSVFDHDHPVWKTESEQWDAMLEYLNGKEVGAA